MGQILQVCYVPFLPHDKPAGIYFNTIITVLVELCRLKRYVEVLNSSTSQWDLIWK